MKITSIIKTIALAATMAFQPVVQATCELPPQQVCYTPGFDGVDSFFSVTVNFSPDPGTYVLPSGAMLPGWCLAKQSPIDTEAQYCGAVMTYSTGSLPPKFAAANWGAVNWLINNRGGADAYDVQDAIWTIIEGEPVSNPTVQTLVNAAISNGVGFVPTPTQATAVLLDMGVGFQFQPIFVEVRCPQPPPPEQNEYCFTAAQKTTCNGTVDASFILDFGTGSRYLTTLPLRLVPVTDTTAMLTGVVYKAGSPSSKFNVNLTLSGYSDPGAQPGWVSYSSASGTLTGLEGFAGLNLMVSSTGSVQIGNGANGINSGFGISAPFNWMYTAGGSGSGHGTLAGLATDCVDITEECLVEYKATSGTHALYLPGIGTDFIAGNKPLHLVESSDGTASITGLVYSASNPTKGFSVNISLSTTTMGAPDGPPKKELSPSAYVENGGPIDPSTWFYYTGFTGTLTGIGDYAGAVINITRYGPAFQVGVGANGKNYNDGASGWFNVTVTKQPSSYYCARLCPTSHGDINVDFGPCVVPPMSCPPPPTCQPKPSCVPSPWNDKNVGNCNYSGSSSCLNSCYTVKGSGCDIWGNKDDCKYVFQNAYGDCEIKAKVCSIDNTDPWAKCGVMIRESMNSDSKHAFACVTAGNGTAFQRRCYTGGSSDHTSGGTGSCWVKLKRTGNTFTCYKSKDGYSWSKVGDCTIKMGTSCYIGLAVTSHNNSKTCEAKVSNVRITK
jgi:hypothetical protein